VIKATGQIKSDGSDQQFPLSSEPPPTAEDEPQAVARHSTLLDGLS